MRITPWEWDRGREGEKATASAAAAEQCGVGGGCGRRTRGVFSERFRTDRPALVGGSDVFARWWTGTGVFKVGRTGAPNGRVGVGHTHWTPMSRLGRSVFLFGPFFLLTALSIFL